MDVFEHVGKLEKYLMKLKSLLKDNGRLIVSDPTENILHKMGRKLAGFSGHYHVRNIYDIKNMLKKVGMQQIRMNSLFQPVPLFRISHWQHITNSLY